MNKVMAGHYKKAKEEGRLCLRCEWMITKKEWKKGRRICWNCEDASKGVNVSHGHYQDRQEPRDMTGDM